MPSASRCSLLLPAVLVVSACREGEEQTANFSPVFGVSDGTQFCAPALTPLTVTPVFTHPDFGLLSQIAAATGTVGADTLYWSGSDGSVHELTLPSGGGANDAVLLPAGEIEATYLLPGITDPAQPSSIAVFDSELLVVAEHASNTLILVDRSAPVTVRRFAGVLSVDGGFSSGQGGDIRFNFGAPPPLLVDSAGFVWVGDSENHAVRRVDFISSPTTVLTIAGTGAAGGAVESNLVNARFDTPSGLTASCLGELLMVESGAAGVAGNVLKSLRIGTEAPFGGFDGSSFVLAGDGTNSTTQGTDRLAQLGTPMGLAATEDGFVYWIDTEGQAVLRRYDFATGISDCPLSPDCATAVVPPGLFTGEAFSLAVGESGALYVLGTTATGGTLWRVD